MSLLDLLAAPVEWTVQSVVTQYIMFEVLALGATLAVLVLHLSKHGEVIITQPKDTTFKKLILASPKEEIIFRGVPLLLAGSFGLDALPVLFVSTMVWATLHAEIQSVHAAIAGVFYIKLWLSGLGLLAVVIHSAHNYAIGRIGGVERESLLDDEFDGKEIETKSRFITVLESPNE